MATINIGSENSGDAFYRYKMPKPISKIEGRGNGIKTNVVNNVDIAKALERPPAYIIKFFGCELGAQTNFDSKNGTSIVNGAHDANTLLSLLELFIKKYVQCYSCGNPETVMKVKKEEITLRCKACGATSNVDMRHKLNNYILKNPPEKQMTKEEKILQKQEKEKMKSLEKEKSQSKKDKKKDKTIIKERKKSLKSESIGDELAEDVSNMELKEEKAVEQPIETHNQKEADNEVEEEDDDEDDGVVWNTDVSAEAIRQRAQEQLTGAVAAMATQGNIEAEASATKKKTKKFLNKVGFPENHIDLVVDVKASLDISDTNAILEVLKEVKSSIKMQVIYTAMFMDTKEKLGAIVSRNVELLKNFSKDDKEQVTQLIGLEYAFGTIVHERMKEAPQVIKVLLDNDIVEDDLVIAWYERPSAGQQSLGISEESGNMVRSNVKPLVEWLMEDSEEEDSEEEED